MKKNLVIGAADNYSWEHIKIWAQSIKDTGFNGDVVLIAYRVSEDLLAGCKQHGIIVIKVDHDEFGNKIDHGFGGLPTQSHKMRNLHIAQFLEENKDVYWIAAITDTRDVYFQTDPNLIFNSLFNLTSSELPLSTIYLPSENIIIDNESWNASMVLKLFGPLIYQKVSQNQACNSGTFFGAVDTLKNLLLEMYFIEKNFQHTGSDQPTLNVLAALRGTILYGQPLYKNDIINILPHDFGWAAQCGTTMDPTKKHLFDYNITSRPKIINGVVVKSDLSTPYCIVHQYDRVPELKLIIEARYT